MSRMKNYWKAYEEGTLHEHSYELIRKAFKSGLLICKNRAEKGNKHSIASLELWEGRHKIVLEWLEEYKASSYFSKEERDVLDEEVDLKHLYDVIVSLRNGNPHPIYTILRRHKAPTNPSVRVLAHISETESLCIYKHAEQEITKAK